MSHCILGVFLISAVGVWGSAAAASSADLDLRNVESLCGGVGPSQPAAEAPRFSITEWLTRIGSPPRALRGSPARSTLLADPVGNGGINSLDQAVTYYFDHGAEATLLDWNCGATAYDTHEGMDVAIPSFYHMDEGMPVLAAAPGEVTYTHDGEFDRRTAWDPQAVGNAVVVQHIDGSYAYYWHLRNGSVRPSVGQLVAVGDTLGMIGSSGISSGPHLHFETWFGESFDPFAGPCTTGESMWKEQSAYVWDLPFQVIGDGLSTFASGWAEVCEWPPDKTHVVSGSRVYSWIMMRNAHQTDQLAIKIYSSSGLWSQWAGTLGGNWSVSWLRLTWVMPGGIYGPWRVDILRNGVVIAQQSFTCDTIPNQLPVVQAETFEVAPPAVLRAPLSASDPDGSVFWHEITTPPQHGTARLYRGRNRYLEYNPGFGFVGLDSLQVRALDDERAPGPATWIRFESSGSTTVDDFPTTAAVLVCSPNPFNPSTMIDFEILTSGRTAVTVFDARGAVVARLLDGNLDVGRHTINWNGTSDDGRSMPSGTYFCRLAAAGVVRTSKLVLIR